MEVSLASPSKETDDSQLFLRRFSTTESACGSSTADRVQCVKEHRRSATMLVGDLER